MEYRPKLRDYRPSDFRRLCEIDHRCFPPGVAYSARDMWGFLGAPGAQAMVAENSKGEVVAFVLALRRRKRGYIVTLDVLPRYRSRGLGRRLMLECEKRLRAAGVAQIQLETAVTNRPAQALYQSLGYTFVRRRPRYYATGEDAWLMEKTLAAVSHQPSAFSRH